MPTLEEISLPLLKRKAPIKAVLLNQNGPLCGIGNWLVDEILFQAAIHPAQRSNTLTTSQLLALHTQIRTVINTAVSANADHTLFPKTWLFMHRWGKGRRAEPKTFQLPDGTMATVVHQTVGGRTSAIVETVQKLVGEPASDDEVDENMEDDQYAEKKPVKKAKTVKADSTENPKRGRKRKIILASAEDGAESDLTSLEASEADEKPFKATPGEKKQSTKAEKEQKPDTELEMGKVKKPRRSRAKKTVKVET